MKTTALAALILMGAGLSLPAQEGQTWATLQGGEAFRSNSNIYQDGMAYGVGGGTWFTNRWGLDLKALRTVQPARYLGYSDTHEYLGLGSLILNVGGTGHPWTPYLAVGAGGSRLHSPFASASTKLNLNAGVGLLGHTSSGFTVQLDAKLVNVATSYQGHFREVLTVAGIGYTWGVPRAAPTVAVTVVEPEPPAPAPAPAPAPVQPPPPPPPPEPVVIPPPPPPVVVIPPPPAKIVLDEARLHFINGKADIDEAGREAVRGVARDLKGYAGRYHVVVIGHTSHTGAKAFNLRLSRERAETVARVLKEEQIPATDITVEGRGWDEPIADNTTEQGQARNRRVEVDIRTNDKNVTTNLVREPTRNSPPPPHRRKVKAIKP